VGFAKLTHDNPAAAAAYVRDIIFMGIKPIPGLESTIRFGGSLNAGNSMSIMMNLCSECPIPFGINAENVTMSWPPLPGPCWILCMPSMSVTDPSI
jgi:hypothetical protein